MRDILLLAITGSLSLVALGRPFVGLVGFIAYSIVAPHSQVWGIARSIPHAYIIILCTFAGYVLSSEPKRIPLGRESLLLLGLWATFGISTMFALSPEEALDKFLYVSRILLVVFLSTSIVNSERRVFVLVITIALSLGIHGLKGGLFALRTGGGGQVFGPDQSFLAANNAIGLALTMNVPLLFYLQKEVSQKWLRQTMRAMVLLSYPAIICTFSRGAWLGLGAVTALIATKSKHKLLTFTFLAVLAMTSSVWESALVSERMSERYDTLVNYEEDGSAQARLWSWQFCANMGLNIRPVTGGGFEFTTPAAYQTYFPEFVEYWSQRMTQVLYWSCHSMWLTVLGEHGLPGFLLWVGLLGSCFFNLGRMRRRSRHYPDLAWLANYADMIQLAFIAYMISGTFLDVAYFDVFYQMIGVVICMSELSKKEISNLSTTPQRTAPVVLTQA